MRARKRKIMIYEAEEYVMVTLQQIADKAGVSRGTVDRALNNRGRINPEVKARIEQIAEELGYQPNRAGKALAMARRSVKIGVIITSTDTPFMQTVLQGIEEAKREVESLGAEVIVKKIKGAKAEDMSAIIDYAANLGLAFQIADDLIDGDEKSIVGAIGESAARTVLKECTDKALASTKKLKNADVLRDFVVKLAERKK